MFDDIFEWVEKDIDNAGQEEEELVLELANEDEETWVAGDHWDTGQLPKNVWRT